jgi:PKD repeat protein
LQKPDPNFFALNGCTGTAINFADSSHSDKSSFYAWNFGDNNSTTVKTISTKHVYQAIGNYKVVLTITNGLGCSDTQSHIVNIINYPKVGFKANAVCLGKATNFTNTSTGTGLTYVWDFGDQTALSKLQTPTHLYSSAGSYAVNLKTFNQYGCPDSISQNVIVNPLPDIQLWGYKKHGYQVTFQPQDTTIGSFVWHFGTGTNDSSSKKIPTFTYPSTPASYQVKLVVTSSSGCVAVRTDSVSVTKSGIESIANTFKGVNVYPNPFEGSTSISYHLASQSEVNIGIYDASGKLIARLRDGTFPAGDYSDIFDAKKYQVSEGIYFLKMYVNDKYYTTKIVNLK